MYLYAADPSLDTAGRLLPGGLPFRRLTEDLIGASLEGAITPHDDTYLVHRQSVVTADGTARYFDAVTALVRAHPDAARYLAPVSDAHVRRLSRSQLGTVCDTAQIVAGFRVPERSVSTAWVADRFVDALTGTPGIAQRLRTTVRAVRRTAAAGDSPLVVEAADGANGPFDAVVNALWEGRLAVDASMGLPPPATWSHRFRLAAFVRTSRAVHVPSLVIATGPFGDIKNYNGRDCYLSWYPTGLVADGSGVLPPALRTLTPADRTRLLGDVMTRLGSVVRGVDELTSCVETVRLEGGWVYAAGRGSLADPASTLHRRDQIGITRAGSYISVDTGKYSVAPWLAHEVSGLIG